MQKIYAAEKIFTGHEWMENAAVVVNGNAIEDVITDVPSDATFFEKSFIVPAFVDAQVYGAAGRLLATFPTADTLRLMQQTFAAEGTALFQPTLATNTLDVFKKSIDALRQYRAEGGTGIWGLHLEGPWIHPTKKGAHIESLVHGPTLEEVKDLLDYGKGLITMITLAPEVCSKEVTDLIRSYNIVISAGHSNATYEKATNAFNGGITAVTHLYNAMSGLHHREPGMVGAVFQHPSVCSSIIPDGHHVNFAAIAIAKKIMGERLFAITDAVTENNEGAYQHHLAGDKYEVDGTLSGSALRMHDAFVNLVKKVEIPIGEAHRMCSLYPANVLGAKRYGRIENGAAAELIVLNKNLDLLKVISGSAV